MDRGAVGLNKSDLKVATQRAIRGAHWLFRRELSRTLGIYLHSLDREKWGAFSSMVSQLRSLDYVFVGPDELCQDDQRKKVFLSFDDNFLSWHESLGLFDELDIRATFYINTLPIRDFASPADLELYTRRIRTTHETFRGLGAEEIRDIARSGHVIGAHTHSHFALASLSEAEGKDEILRSKEILENIIESSVEHFSFPYGMRRFFNENLRQFCVASGFRTVANATPGLQYAGHRPLRIQRSQWDLTRPLAYNISNLRIDGRAFEKVTGRSAAR